MGRLHPREQQQQLACMNETFNKQADLVELFSRPSTASGEPLGRTLLPLYKNFSNKQIKELLEKDGLVVPGNIGSNRDELIKFHKEFLFTVQAGYDAVRMGMFADHPPTKEGLVEAWNSEIRFRERKAQANRSGRLGLSRSVLVSATEKRRAMADSNQSVTEMTIAANRHMMSQVQVALRQRQLHRERLLAQEQDV
jgi:hypothetical protein